ncbi:MAG: hypothetical protein L6425_00030, partial [Candidatus Aminicenantes bacterium]|nr:hypothetical protein [Candidatus Aminicenantes bacterium]
ESVSDSTVGFHGEGGFCFTLSRKIDIDLNLRLYTAKTRGTDINLGDFSIGMGFAYYFLR